MTDSYPRMTFSGQISVKYDNYVLEGKGGGLPFQNYDSKYDATSRSSSLVSRAVYRHRLMQHRTVQSEGLSRFDTIRYVNL